MLRKLFILFGVMALLVGNFSTANALVRLGGRTYTPDETTTAQNIARQEIKVFTGQAASSNAAGATKNINNQIERWLSENHITIIQVKTSTCATAGMGYNGFYITVTIFYSR